MKIGANSRTIEKGVDYVVTGIPNLYYKNHLKGIVTLQKIQLDITDDGLELNFRCDESSCDMDNWCRATFEDGDDKEYAKKLAYNQLKDLTLDGVSRCQMDLRRTGLTIYF